MPITINTYCRINRNGSININTDPAFGFIATTSTTTTTTTLDPINFVCMSGAGDPNGTYQNTFNNVTEQGFTRPIYANANGWYLQIVSSPGGPLWGVWLDGEFYFAGTTQPIPQYPWQSAWSGGVVVAQGPC